MKEFASINEVPTDVHQITANTGEVWHRCPWNPAVGEAEWTMYGPNEGERQPPEVPNVRASQLTKWKFVKAWGRKGL